MPRHTLKAIGILLAILGWLAQSAAPESRIGRLIAPRFIDAMTGYRFLVENAGKDNSILSAHDVGFSEMLALVEAVNPLKTGVPPTGIKYGGLGVTPAGHSLFLEVLGPQGQKIGRANVVNAESRIKSLFFDPVRRSGIPALFFWFGIGVAGAVLTIEVVSGLRKGPRAFQ